MSKPKNAPQNVHGTGLLLGSTGVLLRGPSGAGKSVLALTLLDRWALRGLPAFLVSDDRVDLIQADGQVDMQAPENLAGLIELRGRGIVSRPHQALVSLDLVIDMVPDMVRMLEEDEFVTDIAGTTVPRAPVPFGSVISLGHQMLLVIEAISALDGP
ncbi:HPr kinase/phosphatase C-terminal domain-containing protein [Devosia sp. J2-20]|jgi:serine kinase of HPr protein (carbohydrate metabolism regulator)|uniref:HPr kinase/phosphatase C-terminal domain-containing protein n=1 Tax=Devosia litorisediminis TaxID=2829817 RepID=A0A942IER2_9HYPH|nr:MULTISPECIES: HPr kinase/phosphatase C-terminal domain-containing protein [Devosia]MBS3849685.1 HPr kinase/phosphatase C-terminal domain-containing protein [Devosia litorisediminis]MCZ4347967.1 HPr kinase/phosphatase C-terminal domain-containing protein [Devosia neptuniae]WDR00441.1 HPr kinase/phosphatase C-terminal domain-containing protein [Devosia sp. J2-20]|tara:strand:- start:959 stop:1429 length:471 start_codon:yes stop_codon:yes gene_type:complete